MGAWGIGLLDSDAALDGLDRITEFSFPSNKRYLREEVEDMSATEMVGLADSDAGRLAIAYWLLQNGSSLSDMPRDVLKDALKQQMSADEIGTWFEPADRLRKLEAFKEELAL